MKAFPCLLAVVSFALMSCAGGKEKVATLQDPDHIVPKHFEVCVEASEGDIAALFDRWNMSLQTGDPHKVSANYAPKSLLLPTVSSRLRVTGRDKEDYFHHFLENRPVARIDSRTIELGCNSAIDEGLYTFTFQKTGTSVKARYTFTYKWDGKQWLINSHHSSAMPKEEAPVEEVHSAVGQHPEECVTANEEEIAALFDRWNDSLKSGNPHRVIAHYAPRSVLIPLFSTRPRLTLDDKEDYFHSFLKRRPVGYINSRTIVLNCNTAIDEGLYTLSFPQNAPDVKARYTFIYKWDGNQWLITSDHASLLPSNE
jgi:uncharacterized protein (TIGR02246 family)